MGSLLEQMMERMMASSLETLPEVSVAVAVLAATVVAAAAPADCDVPHSYHKSRIPHSFSISTPPLYLYLHLYPSSYPFHPYECYE